MKYAYTHPSAEYWFFELVKRVTKRYGYQFEVKKSSMANLPSF